MNLRGLAEQLEMEESEFLEIVELFLETSASSLDQLEAAIDGKDAPEAVRAAHSIKGAAANLRFTEIFELAQKMEKEARENRLEGAPYAVQAIRGNLNQIGDSLKQANQ